MARSPGFRAPGFSRCSPPGSDLLTSQLTVNLELLAARVSGILCHKPRGLRPRAAPDCRSPPSAPRRPRSVAPAFTMQAFSQLVNLRGVPLRQSQRCVAAQMRGQARGTCTHLAARNSTTRRYGLLGPVRAVCRELGRSGSGGGLGRACPALAPKAARARFRARAGTPECSPCPWCLQNAGS